MESYRINRIYRVIRRAESQPKAGFACFGEVYHVKLSIFDSGGILFA